MKDSLGRLPLMLLMQKNKLIDDYALLGHVLRYHPDAIDAVDNDGNSAIDNVTFRELTRHTVNEKGKPQAKRQRA